MIMSGWLILNILLQIINVVADLVWQKNFTQNVFFVLLRER